MGKVVKGNAAEGESKVAAKFKVERDMCPVCDKAVYATEKLIVSDTFASKVLHKTCFKCAECASQLNMRTYVSVGDKYYCKPHKPEILRAKGAGDMYAAYGTEYGEGAKESAAAPAVEEKEEEERLKRLKKRRKKLKRKLKKKLK